MRKKLFLSHSSADFESFIKPFADTLEKHHFQVWYSERDIPDFANWADCLNTAIHNSDCILVIISDALLLSPGQCINELRLASQLNKPILTIMLTNKPISKELTYFLGMNAIHWYERSEDDSYKALFQALGSIYNPEAIQISQANSLHMSFQTMAEHTDSIFTGLNDIGGYSWGINKSVVHNLNGGWRLENIQLMQWDDEIFPIEKQPYAEQYNHFLENPVSKGIVLKNKNHTRWMLTEYDTAYDTLFLSIKRTEWMQTQFSWHHLLSETQARQEAIHNFFINEVSLYPTSLCLHLILVDQANNVLASRITNRKRDDYPNTIAVTLGEQLNETDHTISDNFVVQWLQRAMVEEFGFSQQEYCQYLNESSARIMSLTMEGDIYNFALTCCVKLNCTCEQLIDYYRFHRSHDAEFTEIFPIFTEQIPDILQNSRQLKEQYHPSSFLRLLYAYLYITGKLPF